MAANPNSITTPGMQQAAGHFQAAIGNSKTTLDRARGSIASLAIAWTGEASIRLGQAFELWCREYENIIRQLATMHGALVDNAAVYQRTEAANEDLARNVHMTVLSQ